MKPAKKKSSYGAFRSSTEKDKKETQNTIDVLLYYGIGITMTMFLLANFIREHIINLYAIILTAFVLIITYQTYIYPNQKKKKKQPAPPSPS